MERQEVNQDEEQEGQVEVETKNPGAARFGNFINYYQFNPPSARLSLLPRDLLGQLSLPATAAAVTVLDVGCNAGDLTVGLYEQLAGRERCVSVLGVDLDPQLVERAVQHNPHPSNISFITCDLMADTHTSELETWLSRHDSNTFHLATVFSVTMWVHLNHGDAGLGRFLRLLAARARWLLLEPQPWKCYQTAARRARRLGCAGWDLAALQHRGPALQSALLMLAAQAGLSLVAEFGETNWNRKLLLFKRSEQS